jgi:RNA polymerase sigma factor (sigma-70 family)
MSTGESSAVFHDLNVLHHSGSVAGVSDGELLSRFAARGGEAADAAFHALVVRHGPMVLGVCRRLLRDPHDVDDAFQATFLILVRKASDVHVNDSLGRWLYGVSQRVAVRARSNSARRAIREGTEIGVEPPVSPPDHDREERIEALDEELERFLIECIA